jgi:hypothetical protein
MQNIKIFYIFSIIKNRLDKFMIYFKLYVKLCILKTLSLSNNNNTMIKSCSLIFKSLHI